MAYIEVDIDYDDFYDNCSSWEKDELIKLLKQDGLLEKRGLVSADDDEDEQGTGNPLDYEWADMIRKINKSRYQLTPEQEKMLKDLAKSL